jgi:hypothetical protein
MNDSQPIDFSRALIADGPAAQYRARLRRFGQLVGTWDVRGSQLNEATGEWADRSFTWIVSFVLGGLGVQDVEVVRSDDDPAVAVTIASALRIYDPIAGVVRVSYFGPARNQYANLVAIGWRDGIRQDGTQNDSRLVRWNFSSIKADSYVWDGWVSSDDGSTWEHVEHLEGTRVG